MDVMLPVGVSTYFGSILNFDNSYLYSPTIKFLNITHISISTQNIYHMNESENFQFSFAHRGVLWFSYFQHPDLIHQKLL